MIRLTFATLVAFTVATASHARSATPSLDGYNAAPFDVTGTSNTPTAPAASTDAPHSLFVAAPHTLSLPAGLESQLNVMRAGAAAIVAAQAQAKAKAKR